MEKIQLTNASCVFVLSDTAGEILSWPELNVNSDEFQAIISADPSHTKGELAAWFGVTNNKQIDIR